MNPNEFGKKLGIGVRVAGRIAQQRIQEKAAENARNQSQNQQQTQSGASAQSIPASMSAAVPTKEEVLNKSREFAAQSHKYTRAAGRGVGGFLRPFSRVGGILWLQVTGFFFALFGLFFAQDIWRTRLSYLAGPQHQRFLIAVGLTLLFGYLSLSAFWRARRR